MNFRYKDFIKFYNKAEEDYFLQKIFESLVLSVKDHEMERLENAAHYLEIYIDKKNKEDFMNKLVGK